MCLGLLFRILDPIRMPILGELSVTRPDLLLRGPLLQVEHLERVLLTQRVEAVDELVEGGPEAVLQGVRPQRLHVVGELLEGRGLEKVAHGITERNLVTVFGDNVEVEVKVAEPQGPVQRSWIQQKSRIGINQVVS